ncbi:MAG: DUF1329 domain-containing protein [Gammaproteobacteria bacterium]
MIRIRKYTPDYSRRRFLEKSAAGLMGAGVLAPVWTTAAENGDFTKSYPEELLSIEQYTKGALKPGDVINADNVDLVQDLLDPVRYLQIKQQGRVLGVVPASTDITKLSPMEYIEATFRHKGMARFDDTGNVVVGDGKPWVGGNPFPEPTNATELFAAITLTWGRHDVSFYPVKTFEQEADGRIGYRYELVWCEFAPTGRVSVEPMPYWPGHEDKLRYQSVLFTIPQDYKGSSFLNVWPYDQRQFPELQGYLPQFKRVRRFPTSQRFEPLLPGSHLYFSDTWAAGDPFLTWGNYKEVARGPFLAGLTENWDSDDENWEGKTHGGAQGNQFWDTNVELVPEAIVCEAEPTGYARAPISKKRVWFDARTGLPILMVTYDRKGDPFKSFDGAYSVYDNKGKQVMDGKYPYWSWTHVHAHDVQSNHMSRLKQVREISGGWSWWVNRGVDVYDEFLTVAALRRLGT